MPPGGRATIDYTEAERRYVVEKKSIRAISKEMGLRSWSSMNAVAVREDWKGKRAAYDSAIARRSYEVSAATVANEGQQIRDEAVLAGRLTVRAYLKQFEEDPTNPNKKMPHITARDAQVWAAFLLHEATAPAGVSNEVPDVRNVTPADSDLLRRVVEAARGQVAATGDLGPAPLVVASESRPN